MTTSESFTDREGCRHTSKLKDSEISNGSSSNSYDKCAKNLLTEFAAETTNRSNLNAEQFSDVLPLDPDIASTPVSPLIPARFRSISNIMSPKDSPKPLTGWSFILIDGKCVAIFVSWQK